MSQGQEKTEKATPKKREDARRKGQIARGKEFPGALAFLGALFTVSAMSGFVVSRIHIYIQNLAGHIASPRPLTDADIHLFFSDAAKLFALITLPVLLVGSLAIVAGSFAQGGFSFTPEALKPKAEKFSPVKNIKRIFGLDSVVNLIKASIKLVLISFVAYGVLAPVIENAPALLNAPLQTVAVKLGDTLYTLGLRCGMLLLGLAAADYGYAWYKHEKSLRMSKQEIRDEFKQMEGDPMIKGQRRRNARALAQKRSLGEVASATVVVTNPTHFAVALRYDRERDAAPVVVAKGADHVAAKIRQLARENAVPLVENPPLARALYRTVEPNQIIPVEFFGAVAEILAYVFRRGEGGPG